MPAFSESRSQKSLLLKKEHWQEMLDHVLRCLPEEACGLVGGKGGESHLVIPVTNELRSPVRFRMNPQEQFSSFMRLEEQNLDLLAIFHSHPTGPQEPSQTDQLEFAYPDVITIIVAQTEDGWRPRAFLLTVGEEGPVEEIQLSIV